MDSAIKVTDISKSFNGEEVLKGISEEFHLGEITTILGPSGCGKTTLLRIIAGLDVPDAGSVYLFGRLATRGNKVLIPPSRRSIGFIFQDLALWPHMTVFQNIAFGLEVRGEKAIGKKVREIADFFGILPHLEKYPTQLSGGQQQLVALARSLVVEPKLILMDEPLSNLDVRKKAHMRGVIKGLKESFSVGILYVTHDYQEALELSDRIIVIDGGRLMASGTPLQVMESGDPFLKDFFALK